jgi:ATP-dependent DNA helicase RecQ
MLDLELDPPGVDAVLDGHLRTMLGPDATFRDGQREAIESIIADGSRAFVVQRTGWGKSLVYWIATRVRRDAGHGPTLIVSPLLALMRDQIAMAARLGLRALTVNSSNRDDWEQVRSELGAGTCDVLLISPERLANEEFLADYLPSIQGSLGLLVIDEAHCISDWGHDFRPDYRRIARILQTLPPAIPVLGTTATANDRVIRDVVEQVGPATTTIRGPLVRDSLRLQNIVLADQAERLAWLATHIPRLPGSGLIYCLTIADTRRVSAWLQANGIDARAYNADLDPAERERLERALLANECKALVATVALGMGFDKPDLAFVVHFQRPGSVIAYYQQVGRAGRAIDDAVGILLSGSEDDAIQDWFIRTAFPPAADMAAVLEALEASTGMKVTDLERAVNLRRSDIEKALKLLLIDGAVAREKSRYRRTAVAWEPDGARTAAVTETRRAELRHMQAYVRHPGCLMRFLTDALDDPASADCGRCRNCTGEGLSESVTHEAVVAASRFLRGEIRQIEPRKQWPVDAVPGFSGRITPPNEPGICLSILGDAGWGREVADRKALGEPFGQELIAAAVSAIRSHWRPSAKDGWWVCGVPSNRYPVLVRSAADRVAAGLGLPSHELLSISSAAEPQGTMQNGSMLFRNVQGALSIEGSVPVGPVLLVDDTVDSRWTLTVAGWLLHQHGSGPVHPFAFAEASRQPDG